jgi:flavin-binding protein dodecin
VGKLVLCCRNVERISTCSTLLAWRLPEVLMSVARVVEISSTSTKSFDDAVVQGIDRANQTLRNVKSAWVKDQEAEVHDGKVIAYKVNMKVTFVLDGQPV